MNPDRDIVLGVLWGTLGVLWGGEQCHDPGYFRGTLGTGLNS